MRKAVRSAVGLIGMLLLFAACSQQCGSQTSRTTAGCSPSGAAHRAYVVVEHGSGLSITRCIGFSGDFIDGESAMHQSGIEYRATAVSSGKAMCQVDSEPAQLDQCFPQNEPYWALFVASSGHWKSAPGGYTQVKLHDGDAMGWHYVAATDPSPAPPPLPSAPKN
ncbi:MAG TPA: hypothetical protein VNA65_06515 [Candidatus Dormibacteraeota bacterium]|nr:hypothetical protein [Candidatus Dormibacteraeota bacterium]